MEIKITLSVKERILLTQLLPIRGGLIEIRLTKDLADKNQFTLKEIEEFGLKDGSNGSIVSTNTKAFRDTDIEISTAQVRILKASIERLNMEQNITADMLPLIDKINDLVLE